MTIHDWLQLGLMVMFAAAIGWNIYQVIVLKKDVSLIETLKELEELWKAIDRILGELGVETVDQAVEEIQLMKGTAPTPKQENEAWTPPQEPLKPIKPVKFVGK